VVSTILEQNADISTLASFVVEDGRPGAQRVTARYICEFTHLYSSGNQRDAPFGWALLQLIAVQSYTDMVTTTRLWN